MSDPVTIAVGSAAVAYVLSRVHAEENKVEANRIIRDIGELIEDAKEDIKEELRYLRQQELEGEILGIGESLKDYVGVHTRNFLEEILSRVGRLKGLLTVIADDVNNLEDARHAYLLYITMIGVYSIILVEIKFIYSESEEDKRDLEKRKNEIIEDAIIITNKILNASWKKTDKRFALVINLSDEYINYKFDGVPQLEQGPSGQGLYPQEYILEKREEHVQQIFKEYAKDPIEIRKKLFDITSNSLKSFAMNRSVNAPFSVKNDLYPLFDETSTSLRKVMRENSLEIRDHRGEIIPIL
jgi:hypothetical protein